jgi:hypothetical protein
MMVNQIGHKEKVPGPLEDRVSRLRHGCQLVEGVERKELDSRSLVDGIPWHPLVEGLHDPLGPRVPVSHREVQELLPFVQEAEILAPRVHADAGDGAGARSAN